MDILFGVGKFRVTAAFVAFGACVLMVVYPDVSLLSAQKGIALFAGNVLPALLPFFICAGFMNALGFSRILPTRLFVFSMSVFSGYPIGAKIIGDMRRRGEITLSEAKSMISYCSTSGPAFILGSVGAGMLGSVKAGVVIAVSHYIAALITGLIFTALVYHFSLEETLPLSCTKISSGAAEQSASSILAIFTDSIVEALRSLGIILAYIVLFMFAGDLLTHFGVFDFVKSENAVIILKGIIEMTVGCSGVSELDLSLMNRTVIISFLVSFGGLSVIGQSLSMLSGSGISSGYFIITKICHGLIAAVLSYIIVI